MRFDLPRSAPARASPVLSVLGWHAHAEGERQAGRAARGVRDRSRRGQDRLAARSATSKSSAASATARGRRDIRRGFGARKGNRAVASVGFRRGLCVRHCATALLLRGDEAWTRPLCSARTSRSSVRVGQRHFVVTGSARRVLGGRGSLGRAWTAQPERCSRQQAELACFMATAAFRHLAFCSGVRAQTLARVRSTRPGSPSRGASGRPARTAERACARRRKPVWVLHAAHDFAKLAASWSSRELFTARRSMREKSSIGRRPYFRYSRPTLRSSLGRHPPQRIPCDPGRAGSPCRRASRHRARRFHCLGERFGHLLDRSEIEDHQRGSWRIRSFPGAVRRGTRRDRRAS